MSGADPFLWSRADASVSPAGGPHPPAGHPPICCVSRGALLRACRSLSLKGRCANFSPCRGRTLARALPKDQRDKDLWRFSRYEADYPLKKELRVLNASFSYNPIEWLGPRPMSTRTS